MADNEIIKALECCIDEDINSCDKCPIKIECYTQTVDITKEALNLINRQQAEIERLKAEDEKYPFKCVMPFNSMVCSKSIEDYDRLVGDIGADAIKEFAEKCKTELRTGEIIMDKSIRDIIDNLVKEMVGEQE